MASARTQSRDLLLRQFDVAWQLAWYHLETLTDDECLWRPAARGLHVHHQNGQWIADWPTHEGYDLGASSAAWIEWHWLFWWRMAIDQTWGAATRTRESIRWPGSPAAARQELKELHDQWRAKLEASNDDDLARSEQVRWPFHDRSMGDLFAWANTELTKSAAELGMVRFLYGARLATEPEPSR